MRRPIASRETNWAKRVAKTLAARGVTPNFVSASSVVFAALAGITLALAPRVDGHSFKIALFIAAAIFIQLRLLCNLFDGMLAVEFGKASAQGAIWNDFPDRPADVFSLVGCGYSGGPDWMPTLGWIAAGLALLTAYTRVLGAAIGGGEYFIGPMAKQHRMAVATIASLFCALEAILGFMPRVMTIALVVIIVGCILTTARRLKLISRGLEEAAQV